MLLAQGCSLKRIIHPFRFGELLRLQGWLAYLKEEISKRSVEARDREAQSLNNPVIWKTSLYCAYENFAAAKTDYFYDGQEQRGLEKYFGIKNGK